MTPLSVNASLALLCRRWTVSLNLRFCSLHLSCVHSLFAFVYVLVRAHICMCVNEGSWCCVINTTANVPKG